jgi:Mor family transcriptional regulator
MQAVIREFRNLLGDSDSMKLEAHFAGREIYIPARMKADHDIAKTIGLKAAELVAARFGGWRMRFPMLIESEPRDIRNARILEAHRAGESFGSIARREKLSRFHVGRIVRAAA